MRRTLALLLATALVVGLLGACTTVSGPPTEPNDREWNLLMADYAWLETLRKAQPAPAPSLSRKQMIAAELESHRKIDEPRNAFMAKLTEYSERTHDPRAAKVLEQAVALAQAARDPRQEAWSRSMLGRLDLFRDSLDTASEQLEASIGLAEREHWLAFLPWPQALLGEVRLAHGDLPGATALLEQAFARACQMGDPCWEGISAHGLGLVAEATGDAGQAFTILVDARRRASRLADPYVWLDGYILDAQCELGRRHDHPATKVWVEAMRALAARTGMREFGRRSLRHGAALGNEGDAEAAAMLAAVPSDS